MQATLEVLYEDNHLLVVNKPATLPTMGAPADQETLVDRAKAYLKAKYDKPGNVFLGVVSRLDAPVTGAVLLARTSKAASRLADQFRSRSVQKTYWALIPSPIEPAALEIVTWLKKHERHRKVLVVAANSPESQEARLRYRRIKDFGRDCLVEIDLLTGRKHQIRVQLADHGNPIVGDRKYGSQRSFPKGIALHSRSLVFDHPVRDEEVRVEAPLPPYWPVLARRIAE